ncbi:MAG: RNA polymerase sigma factor [Deltaproteobacteria bacterium]|nr:RNA polymerase sigma factor [Deltaproteobacteria bacterium]
MTKKACQPDELRRRATAGDPALLADLFTCFRTDLISFLRQRCGHAGDADDALQDAFVAATRYLSGYRGETPLKNWLYRLASTACTRMRRGRKNNPKLHATYEDGQAASIEKMGQDVEAMIEAKLSPLQKALAILNDKDRAVLMLRDGEQLPAREVAITLDVTELAVKSRLHRARKAVQEYLSK